jgi:hypothetical protein
VAFPGAPAGILFPTDPGVPRTLAPPGKRDFAPRAGLAYAPDSKTSLRASFGMFYTAIEALTIGIMSANAPYGTTYTSPAPPLFATPFIGAANGQSAGQYFPVQLAPLNTTASHPDASLDWSQFEPISGMPNYPTTNRCSASAMWARRRIACWCWRKPIPATRRYACSSAIRPCSRPDKRPADHLTKATSSPRRRAG